MVGGRVLKVYDDWRADPGCDGSLLVLADALQEVGDGRGEFLMLDYRCRTENDSKERERLLAARTVLLRELFRIEGFDDRYRLYNVFHDGELYDVDLSRSLLDGGRSHEQGWWLEKIGDGDFGEWRIPSSKLCNSIVFSLCDNQNTKLVSEVKGMLAQGFKDYYMMTSTRATYKAKGLDLLVHDLSYPTEKRLNTALVGPDGYVNAGCGFENEMRALLGTGDLNKIEQAYEWLTGKKPYIWRLNSKPEKDEERAVVLGVNFVRFGIIADSDVIRRALGVVAKKISTGNKG
jgi:hypothetical protein